MHQANHYSNFLSKNAVWHEKLSVQITSKSVWNNYGMLRSTYYNSRQLERKQIDKSRFRITYSLPAIYIAYSDHSSFSLFLISARQLKGKIAITSFCRSYSLYKSRDCAVSQLSQYCIYRSITCAFDSMTLLNLTKKTADNNPVNTPASRCLK